MNGHQSKGLKALKLKANFRCFLVSSVRSYKNGEAIARKKTGKYHFQLNLGKQDDCVHKDEGI